MSNNSSEQTTRSHENYDSFNEQKRKERMAALLVSAGILLPIGLAKVAPEGPEAPSPVNDGVSHLEIPEGEDPGNWEIVGGEMVRKGGPGEQLQQGTMHNKGGPEDRLLDGFDSSVVDYPIEGNLNPNPNAPQSGQNADAGRGD